MFSVTGTTIKHNWQTISHVIRTLEHKAEMNIKMKRIFAPFITPVIGKGRALHYNTS